MTQTDNEKSHIAVLDGLRAIAILLVMFRHSTRMYWTDVSKPFLPVGPFDLGNFFINGWCGVDLFFVLSGFLIAQQLLAAFGSGKAKGAETLYFYKKRFFRIAPAYYLILTLICFGLFPPYPIQHPETVWGWRYIYHLLFLHDIFPPDILPLFWSLAIEAQFYIVAPLVMLGLMRLRGKKAYAALVFAAVLSLGVKIWAALHFFPEGASYETFEWTMRMRQPYSLDGFIVGALAAFIWHEPDGRALLQRPRVANTLFVAGALLAFGITGLLPPIDNGVSPYDAMFRTPLLSYGFGMMMLGLLGNCAGSNFFKLRPLRFTAKISYSLYLIHCLLQVPCFYFAAGILGSSVDHPVSSWLLFHVPYFMGSFFFAALCYIWVERPCIDWSKKRKP